MRSYPGATRARTCCGIGIEKAAVVAILGFIGIVALARVGPQPMAASPSSAMGFVTGVGEGDLFVASWNIAAVNNNPFEYWITYNEDPNYTSLMAGVEEYLENPGKRDVPVKKVFTPHMFALLKEKMLEVGWEKSQVAVVEKLWEDDYSNRKIIDEFMKDETLGSKRLASMPDRVTNTINVVGDTSHIPSECSKGQICRPTVINMYSGDLSSQDKWFAQWMEYIFDTSVTIQSSSGTTTSVIYEMLQPIKKSKYPAISEEEEAVSVPLQTMCGAIFDAILVHMMNDLAPDTWQPLKSKLVEKLNKKKMQRTLEILIESYAEADVILLQEVAAAFIEEAQDSVLGKDFHVAIPDALDGKRDQNSVILLSKATFPLGADEEVTSLVNEQFPEGVQVPVAAGDIFSLTTRHKDGTPFFFSSFHGDTNGMATIPVTKAIKKASDTPKLSEHTFVFGLDANTYEPKDSLDPKKWQSVVEYGRSFVGLGLTSCFGDVPDPTWYTTFNARTYLQPQLNKACKSSEKRECGDVNPKDFILVKPSQLVPKNRWRDNTGSRSYIENTVFPTLQFPSDHGVLSAVFGRKE